MLVQGCVAVGPVQAGCGACVTQCVIAAFCQKGFLKENPLHCTKEVELCCGCAGSHVEFAYRRAIVALHSQSSSSQVAPIALLAWLHPAAAATPRQADRASLAVACGTRCRLKPRCKASAVTWRRMGPRSGSGRPPHPPGPGLLVLQHRASSSPAGGQCLAREAPTSHCEVHTSAAGFAHPTRPPLPAPSPDRALGSSSPPGHTHALCGERGGSHVSCDTCHSLGGGSSTGTWCTLPGAPGVFVCCAAVGTPWDVSRVHLAKQGAR